MEHSKNYIALVSFFPPISKRSHRRARTHEKQYQDTLNHISEMNAQRGKQIGSNIHQLSAKYGITPYSDLTEDEFLSLHLNKHIALRLKMNQSGADGRSEDSDKATDADTDGPLTDYEKYNYVYADKKALEKSLPVKVDW